MTPRAAVVHRQQHAALMNDRLRSNWIAAAVNSQGLTYTHTKSDERGLIHCIFFTNELKEEKSDDDAAPSATERKKEIGINHLLLLLQRKRRKKEKGGRRGRDRCPLSFHSRREERARGGACYRSENALIVRAWSYSCNGWGDLYYFLK